MTARTTRRVLMTAALLASFAGTPALAQPAAPAAAAEQAPAVVDERADEILAKAVKYAFGSDAEDRTVETMHIKGNMSAPAMGIEGTIEMWGDLENGSIIAKSVVPGMTEELQGITEGAAWSNSSMSGPRLLTDEEAAQLRQELDFYADVDFETTYSTREYLGEETIDGETAHQLRLIRADDATESRRWFTDEGKLVKQVSSQVSPMGIMEITSTFSDYRAVGAAGGMMPYSTTIAFGGFEQVITMEFVEFNVEMDDDTFTPPEAVQKLMDN